ncbi:hypothetical protein KA107_01255 [Candidatus Pacearchaeota archaeon]|nr:hypothetical protein [Candidatus Pacearchaeota archaeon]
MVEQPPRKLERLTQDAAGTLHRAGGKVLFSSEVHHAGKIMPLVVLNPCNDISEVIDEMVKRDSTVIPAGANSYVVSDFCGDTQHVRESSEDGSKKLYSVFAIQFYFRL